MAGKGTLIKCENVFLHFDVVVLPAFLHLLLQFLEKELLYCVIQNAGSIGLWFSKWVF